jgi:hypothetical protein
MARENFADFALTALVSPSPLTVSGTSFTVTSGQGALFPVTNFLVTIDTEVLFISSRSGDTFTVGTRGFDGTTATSHSVGASIQLSASAYNFTHIWQNVADAANPLVPPVQLGGSAGSWDNEFESTGSWTLYPSAPASGSVWNAGGSLRSHLLLDRASTDNTTYTAYIAFTPPASTKFMITMKLSDAISFVANINSGHQATTWLQVTDQSNPVTDSGTGNRFQGKIVLENTTESSGSAGNAQNSIFSTINQIYVHQLIAHAAVSGASVAISPAVIIAPFLPLFCRIYYNGSGTYTFLVGDGSVYWQIGSWSGLTFTPQSLCVQFQATSLSCTHAIDFIRVVTGSAASNPTFG